MGMVLQEMPVVLARVPRHLNLKDLRHFLGVMLEVPCELFDGCCCRHILEVRPEGSEDLVGHPLCGDDSVDEAVRPEEVGNGLGFRTRDDLDDLHEHL